EMSAGRPPCEGARRGVITPGVTALEPPPLDDGVPAELREIVSRALRKDRAERYQSVYKLLADLRPLKRELRTSGHLKVAFQPRAWSEATLITGGTGLDTSTQAVGLRTVAESGSISPGVGSRLGRLASVLKRRAWVLPALLALGALAWLAYFYSRPAKTAIDSLAVLPFVNTGLGANLDASADAEYLADGLTDGLINSLSQLPNVHVTARGSVFRFKKDQSDPQAIARRLGVRAVLTGRIAQRGDALSISAELMDARDGSHLWGAQYERRLSDFIVVQE